jgi:predicted esterase
MTAADRSVRVLGAVIALLLASGSLAVLEHPDPVSARARLATLAVPATPSTAPTWAPTTATVPPTTTTPPPDTTTTQPPPPPPPASWRVGFTTLTFVDGSRPTPPTAGDPGKPSRTLPTVILYPIDGSPAAPPAVSAPAASRGGPFPLIVFAHGFNSSPQVYASLLEAWAGAGYVVAAPEFPRTVAGGHVDESDLDRQPGDVSFVIGKIVAGALPAGLVDASRIGVAGHSDGAVTAVGVGYNTCCHDGRVSADVVMAGDAHVFSGGSYFAKGSPPLLVLQGDHDPSNDPSLGQQLYQAAPSPKVLIMLVDALHLQPFTTDLPHLGVVEAATIGFFDRYLKGRSDGVGRLDQAARPPLASLTTG